MASPPLTLALLFPGQGAQKVGMGRALASAHPEAARVFQEADDALGIALSRLMWEGPEEELTLTQNAQPAILVHSLAVWRLLETRVGPVALAAGHSLGELTAHAAAGTFTFADAVRLVRARGELMFRAGQERPGTMGAILGLADEAIGEVCARVTAGVCVTANFNTAGQVVISGDVAGVEEGMRLAREAGAARAVELKVSGAFHSPLMAPAQEGLRGRLEAVNFRDPSFPVVSNVTASPVTGAGEARELLVRQLTSPVQWAASVGHMVSAGVGRFLELGPGTVLCGLNKRNARGVPCTSVGEPDAVAALEAAEEAGP